MHKRKFQYFTIFLFLILNTQIHAQVDSLHKYIELDDDDTSEVFISIEDLDRDDELNEEEFDFVSYIENHPNLEFIIKNSTNPIITDFYDLGYLITNTHPELGYGYGGKVDFYDTSGNAIQTQIDSNFTRLKCRNFYGFYSKDKKKEGLKTISGRVVFEPIFKQFGEFKNPFTWFELDEKYGMIDSTGKIIIPAEYKVIIERLNGAFYAMEKEKWYLNPRKPRGKIYYFNTFSGKILPDEYEVESYLEGGFLWARSNETKKYYLLDPDFQTIFESESRHFEKLEPTIFSIKKGLEFIVYKRIENAFNEIHRGNSVMRSRHPDYYKIINDGSSTLVDKDFKPVFNEKYDVLAGGKNGCLLKNQKKEIFIFNKKKQLHAIGKIEDPKIWDSYFFGMKKDTSIAFNQEGKVIFKSKSLKVIGVLNEENFRVSNENNDWSIVTQKGQNIMEGGYEQELTSQSDILKFSKEGKKGLVDMDGNILAEAKYKYIHDEGAGFFHLFEGEKGTGRFIHKSGKIDIPAAFVSGHLVKGKFISFLDKHNRYYFVKYKGL